MNKFLKLRSCSDLYELASAIKVYNNHIAALFSINFISVILNIDSTGAPCMSSTTFHDRKKTNVN